MNRHHLTRIFPFLEWAKTYNRQTASQDGIAAFIVTLMLIPQSLAYAMLAGLPPVVGLYASILPLIAYTLFGTSRALAVGPVAVISLMTATALSPLFVAGSVEYVQAALLLTFLSGIILMILALLRFGFLVNFISHPVVSGFVTASAILIILGQTRHLLGIEAHGHNALTLLQSVIPQLINIHPFTLALSTFSVGFLLLARYYGQRTLQALGLPQKHAELLNKLAPVVALVACTSAVMMWQLDTRGVAVVGDVPIGLPNFHWPTLDWALMRQLFPIALLISIVGFVESVSVAQTFAARRRQRIDPNQELVGLGTANLASAFSGGMPVTGGFSRSVVNFDAGAQTPLAGTFSAIAIALTVLFFTPLFAYLPQAVLAATITVAVLGLIDFSAVKRTWRYSRQDGAAMLMTMLGVLLIDVEVGIVFGVALSLLLFLWRTSQPHIAVLGQLPGTQHFRNIERFHVIESPTVLSIRVDESLYFPNARYLEDRIAALIEQRPKMQHLVLLCTGINLIDASALESLEAIMERLHTAGIQLHLSEVKGPVMDQLQRSTFFQHFNGQVFTSHFDALRTLDSCTTEQTFLAQHDAKIP